MWRNRESKILLYTMVAVALVGAAIGYTLCGPIAVIIVLATCFFIIVITILTTRQRYKNIAALNIYLEKILAGDEAPEILDQKEGELSILKSNIYKATTTLKYQKELLSKDRIRLADAMADISHQLKTPLTSLMVMNDLLMSESDEEKRSEFLMTQSAQVDRMNWLIQTLLKISKLDAGTIEMRPEIIEGKDLISDALRPFEIQMEIKNITLKRGQESYPLKCDKNWTMEAIQNIVKNCIEHIDEGGSLEVSMEDTNIFTQIIVKDTGCGINKEDLPHIFERFYKGKNAGKDSVGIGLALAQGIIKNQQGEILVESEENVGTTFYIRFYKTIV